jgi:uncharacterized repeat protein (TIGR03843 family)
VDRDRRRAARRPRARGAGARGLVARAARHRPARRPGLVDPPRRRADAVINNADRKASHFLPDASGHVWGCDHGVCFNVEPKLRTVLWGWADEPLHDDELEALVALRARLEGQPGRDALADCISMAEYLQLLERIDDLIRLGRLPDPGDHWPSIPWPVFS